MLTKGDDFPLHQSAEPIAFAGTDRNFYDRYFFNGYSPDGSVFFAAAMGFYPQLGIVDAAFCVLAGGVQHNLRASRRSGGERLDLSVGPIAIAIDAPLETLTLRIAANDGPLAAELRFTARHFPIEEPRFTRRNGTRLFMDYTRMTQNGHWSGWLSVDGARVDVGADWAGTRDRSWGIRPVGAAEPQPPPQGNFHQFFWLWTPCNFEDRSLFFHSNDDGEGSPWNRRAVLVGANGGERHYADPAFVAEWQPGTRRLSKLTADFDGKTRLTLTPSGPVFAMSGLGYTHPVWGHGFDHGDLEVSHDSLSEAERMWGNPLAMHVQALIRADLADGDRSESGVGVLEQLFVGPHAPTGLTRLMDPAP
ncbi:hypothetical protein ATE68_20815 [Sphingopyxis sp. H038]|uniref:hypothetical protein n=2 Tax=Sphingopyxis TaxID=165697 RepID=UPI00072FC380|nr:MULTISPECIES: hypothetical protein [unclassified Sphingopyxis]KTE01338.1 hypothetical protein ATE78_14070 [Sphingopyxis sp. H012]KTE07562.1 hypothetical protein ATE76_17370 [Sphingopyxis sp. H093]KTE12734.1 hypothetical protein ATE70_05720 [Sphingopyxis sp. H053]KTE24898.1 hypothetical protein ATE75_17465 [Sphingopyxis sp. H080]KTE31990.1 hypothetical protein ATE68_20815 [Sphingopyxis sp. H038]